MKIERTTNGYRIDFESGNSVYTEHAPPLRGSRPELRKVENQLTNCSAEEWGLADQFIEQYNRGERQINVQLPGTIIPTDLEGGLVFIDPTRKNSK